MGGGLSKSAYWVVYISEKEKQACSKLPVNTYDATNAEQEKQHPYGTALSDAKIVDKILADNRDLIREVDNFKNTEVAKKVTTLYEKYYEEIAKAMDTKLAIKDIASIYTTLLARPETKDLGKRLLLD